MYRWLLYILILFIVSCNSENKKNGIVADNGRPGSNVESRTLDIQEQNTTGDNTIQTKTVKGIRFSFAAISALDFLARNNKIPTAADAEDLKEETVIIVELSDTNQFHSVFNNVHATLSKDEMIQYLVGDFVNDFWLTQNGKRINPNGIQYEGIIGANENKIRVLTFFTGINIQENYTIQYTDKLFDAGIIKVSKKHKQQSV